MELDKKTLANTLGIDVTNKEFRLLLDELENNFDFNIDIDGNEYRFISENRIWDIYYDEQRDLIEEIYLPAIDKVWWIEIDWDKTIDNVFTDGYGHHFSTYDGSEEQIKFNNEFYYIFKIG
jgi:hypothetical protein